MRTTVGLSKSHNLTSLGHQLDSSPEALGELSSSTEYVEDDATLAGRMRQDGYLYLPGYLDRDLVLEAREAVVARLAEEGLVDTNYPLLDAIATPMAISKEKDTFGIGSDAEPLQRLLYSGRLIEFFEQFLGGEVRHFDFTWLRALPPGHGTPPHGDSPFMNRGTHNLYTAWTPLGDVDYELGGLMMLEASHLIGDIKNGYGMKDVDEYCVNRADAELYRSGQKSWSGHVSKNPRQLREALGGRWLTTEFAAGDLLVFSIFTIHASLDNTSKNRLRMSSDSRYQLASEPTDERWIGPNPTGHTTAGKRGRIC